MNFDFTYFIHALLIFLLCYFVYAYVIPVIKHRFLVLVFTQLEPGSIYYSRYTRHLRPMRNISSGIIMSVGKRIFNQAQIKLYMEVID